jgi:ribosomal protein S27AE
MVLESKQTTLAYRCPHCGAGVMSAVSMFHLKGSMIRLKCDCGKSVMEALPAKDGKVHLTVPCIICPNPHRFTVSEKIFFGKELFALPCPYSDINICVMGETNHVKAELSRTELQLLDLMEKSGISDFEALHEEAEQRVTDPQVLEIVLFVIRDLDEEGKIKCRCAEGEEGEYDAEILPEGVRVTCKKCGATKLLPTDSLLDAHDFLNCDYLELE